MSKYQPKPAIYTDPLKEGSLRSDVSSFLEMLKRTFYLFVGLCFGKQILR